MKIISQDESPRRNACFCILNNQVVPDIGEI